MDCSEMKVLMSVTTEEAGAVIGKMVWELKPSGRCQEQESKCQRRKMIVGKRYQDSRGSERSCFGQALDQDEDGGAQGEPS